MQPRFPRDHHFHLRNRHLPTARGDAALSTQEFAAVTDRAVTYLIRQCLPAFDVSDPRGAA